MDAIEIVDGNIQIGNGGQLEAFKFLQSVFRFRYPSIFDDIRNSFFVIKKLNHLEGSNSRVF